jgi:transaldolase
VLQQLAELGIDLDAVNDQLVAQGVKKFQEPFDALLESIRRRARD